MPDWRLSYQMKALSGCAGKMVCGLSNVFYYDPRLDRAWSYNYPERQRRWVAGNTIYYHKDLWRQHQFPRISQGEDTRFVWSLPEAAILPLANNKFLVATVHGKNSSPKRTEDRCWRPHAAEDVRSILGADFAFYEEWPSALVGVTA